MLGAVLRRWNSSSSTYDRDGNDGWRRVGEPSSPRPRDESRAAMLHVVRHTNDHGKIVSQAQVKSSLAKYRARNEPNTPPLSIRFYACHTSRVSCASSRFALCVKPYRGIRGRAPRRAPAARGPGSGLSVSHTAPTPRQHRCVYLGDIMSQITDGPSRNLYYTPETLCLNRRGF